MDSKLQIQLAKEAGKYDHPNYKGETWVNLYKNHLGMVTEPLPFGKFKMKFVELNSILDKDPEGKIRRYDSVIQRLSIELGC